MSTCTMRRRLGEGTGGLYDCWRMTGGGKCSQSERHGHRGDMAIGETWPSGRHGNRGDKSIGETSQSERQVNRGDMAIGETWQSGRHVNRGDMSIGETWQSRRHVNRGDMSIGEAWQSERQVNRGDMSIGETCQSERQVNRGDMAIGETWQSGRPVGRTTNSTPIGRYNPGSMEVSMTGRLLSAAVLVIALLVAWGCSQPPAAPKTAQPVCRARREARRQLPVRPRRLDLRAPRGAARHARLPARLPAGRRDGRPAAGVSRLHASIRPRRTGRSTARAAEQILWPKMDAEYQQEIDGIVAGLTREAGDRRPVGHRRAQRDRGTARLLRPVAREAAGEEADPEGARQLQRLRGHRQLHEGRQDRHRPQRVDQLRRPARAGTSSST